MGSDRTTAGSRIHHAIIQAAQAHQGQFRKGTKVDYLVHPMEVLEILSSMHADTDLMIAGILHDTVEDTPLTLDMIRENFGDNVASLVGRHTENKDLSWKERKTDAVATLRSAEKRYQMLILADALSNLRSMAADYMVEGEELWKRFHAPREKQCWYYGAMRDAMAPLGGQADCRSKYEEFCQIYEEVFLS